jgi:hypothetical protein
MTLKLTLDAFSGRPNPSVDLTPQEAADLVARLGPVTAAPAAGAALAQPAKLGYRGIVIEQTGQVSANLPQRFRLSGNQVIGPTGVLKTVDAAIEQSLLGNAALLARAGVPAAVASALVAQSAAHAHAAAPSTSATPGPLTCRCAPLYEPAWWSDLASGGSRQINNNCYNYACDIRTDTFAQPGHAANAMYTAETCPALRVAAQADMLTEIKLTTITCPPEGHLIALVIWPNVDFHFYRMNRDGLWSHKPGGMPVTNVDNSNKLIPDPRAADRGPYVNFCEFMIVMHGHVKIK